MCNLYDVGPPPEKARLDWELPFHDAVVGRTYVAPGKPGVAGRLSRDAGARIEPVLLRWGFRRPWSEAINNARDDKLDGTPWKESWRHRRCVIPMRRFFEWGGVPGRKTKHAVRPADAVDTWFWAGGVWEEDPGSEGGGSFSLITVPANDAMRPLHDRMPLLLVPGDERRFLESGEPPTELVRPFPGFLWIDPPPEPEPWF
jgi:putative SOS response-associated peptidase YedK